MTADAPDDSRPQDEELASDLAQALKVASATGTLASPVSHSDLVRMVVETAVHVISARGGSLLLLDEEKDELVFEVAVGSEAAELAGLRVPLGHGVAGLVAATGQPMAVSNADEDPRVASDVAERIDYTPESLLCVPLVYGDRVVGVLELVDKVGAASFSSDDVADLSMFARQAAVTVRQSRSHRSLPALMAEVLDALGSDHAAALGERAHAFAARVEEDASYGQTIALAELVHEIASRGDEELRACQEILRSFAEYLRAKPRAGGEELE